MDLSDLRISHGDDEPSGENLEYDPAFISLELAAQFGEERQVGDSIIAAEEPDHREVIGHAKEVLERSHDIRAAVFLGHSLLRTEGFRGFADATGLIRWMLEEYWDTCHPQLDADDDDDPTMRVNAVVSLKDGDSILRGLRLAPITESRAFGRFSLRDILIAEGETPPPSGVEDVPDTSKISAAFQDTDTDRLTQTRATVDSILADVRAINAVFDDKIPGGGPDLEDLERLLKLILAKLSAYGVGGDDDSAPGDEESSDDDSGSYAAASGGGGQSGPRPAAGGGGGGGGSGQINNQQDVKAMLDRLIQYYERIEPSSPVPVLLARCKRLVGADFITIIKDIAPEGKMQAYMVGGIPDDDDD